MPMTTTYMGLSLKNPIVVASSGLVRTIDGVKRCVDAGAGAVVLKSLFEEQFEPENLDIERNIQESWHAEAFDYVRRLTRDLGPETYLRLVEDAKRAVEIPVIASLNCVSQRWWGEYAARLEGAGADGIELNVAIMPSDPAVPGHEIEAQYIRIVDAVRAQVKVPVAVKVGPYFTSMSRMARQFVDHGVSALVLFNRFYQFDIDVSRIEIGAGNRFSIPQEMGTSLRWIALLSGRVGCDLAAATGIHDGLSAIKFFLAGATAVQVSSAIYLHGFGRIGEMLAAMERWLVSKGFSSLAEIKGRLSQAESATPERFERLQYLKAVSGVE